MKKDYDQLIVKFIRKDKIRKKQFFAFTTIGSRAVLTESLVVNV